MLQHLPRTRTQTCLSRRKFARKGRRYFLFPMVLCASSPVTRVSLAFRACLCAKNEAPEDQAVATLAEEIDSGRAKNTSGEILINQYTSIVFGQQGKTL